MPIQRRRRPVGLLGSLLRGWVTAAAAPALLQAQQSQLAVLVPPALASAAAPLVLRGVTVIDVRAGRRLADRTVVIVGNRIQRIAPAGKARLPQGARVMDARSKYLIPGLWDMHAHPRGYEDIAYPLFLANGVTGVRDAGSYTPLATLAQWKREITRGTRIGPRLIVAGPMVGEAPSGDSVVPDPMGILAVPLSLLAHVVDSLQSAGADFIKTYGDSPQWYFTLAAAARRRGLLFGGHVPDGRGLDASDSGATFLDHGPWVHGCDGSDSFDTVKCAAVARRFRHNHSWLVIQTAWPDSLVGQSSAAWDARHKLRGWRYWHGGGDDTSAAAMAAWARIAAREPTSIADWAWRTQRVSSIAQLVPAWYAAGMPLLLGTDLGITMMTEYMVPGFFLQEGLAALAMSGPPPLAALQTVTLNPALALRATDSLGTVAVGKVADLVLLDADPLADMWNTTKIRAVVANGRYYDRGALDQLLVQAQELTRQASYEPMTPRRHGN